MKDVTFKYLVNGERIVQNRLTESKISRVFGSAEYSIVGDVPKNKEINKIRIIIHGQTDSKPFKEELVLTPCLDSIKPRLETDDENLLLGLRVWPNSNLYSYSLVYLPIISRNWTF